MEAILLAPFVFNDVTFTRLPKSLLTLPKIEAIYYSDGTSKENYEELKKAYGDKLKPKRQPK